MCQGIVIREEPIDTSYRRFYTATQIMLKKAEMDKNG